MVFKGRQVTAVIPALDEETSIGLVISELSDLRDGQGRAVVDEIIVCDNGSTDGTAKIARSLGATVVTEPERGYGAACQFALVEYWRRIPSGDDIVVFVDADHSVKTSELPDLLAPVSAGAEVVIGNRNAGSSQSGALTPQQVFGNWLATTLISLIWKTSVNDLGPFRAITADALRRIAMRDRAFGWTCEMQIRAIQENLDMVEVPVSSLRRIGKSKISGTIAGSLKAGHGILGMVYALRRNELRLHRQGIIEHV